MHTGAFKVPLHPLYLPSLPPITTAEIGSAQACDPLPTSVMWQGPSLALSMGLQLPGPGLLEPWGAGYLNSHTCSLVGGDSQRQRGHPGSRRGKSPWSNASPFSCPGHSALTCISQGSLRGLGVVNHKLLPALVSVWKHPDNGFYSLHSCSLKSFPR